jgi:hypothetical protein
MKITPPADDYGLQMLKQADSHREIKETGKVEAYPRIGSSEERHEPRQPLVSKRRQQRRRQERRVGTQQTLLDTRNGHERRQSVRREEDNAVTTPNDPSLPHGIDDFA